MSKGKYDKLRRGLMANPIPVTRRLPGQPPAPITEPVQDKLPLAEDFSDLKISLTDGILDVSVAEIHPDIQKVMDQHWSKVKVEGLAEGLRLKEEGQTKALTGAASWAERANTWIAGLPTGRYFTSNDLLQHVDLPHPDAAKPNQNNAVGAIFSSASKRGLIRKTGDYEPSIRAANRGAVVAIWVRSGKL